MQHQLALLTSGILLASAAATTSANVIFSEYIEGSGNNKALELQNTGSEAVDLSTYSIELYANGSVTAGNTESLTGTIAAGSYYVIANSSAVADITDIANITSSVTYFNGNDVLLLKDGDNVVDRIGQLGNSENFAQNVTLVRNSDITNGDIAYEDAFDADLEWTEYDQDTFDYLGNGDGGDDDGETGPTIPDYASELTIMEVQGDDDSSPYIADGAYSSTDNYKVTGIVTGIQDDSTDDVLSLGLFIQDADGDNDAATSDGIYVYYTDVADLGLSIGDEVSVYGPISEYYDQTQLSAIYIEATGNTDSISVTPLRTTSSDIDFEDTLERHEGMYVELDEAADMFITRTFGFDYDSYRNNMVVSNGDWNNHPNQYFGPTSDGATTQAENNALNRLFVEAMNEGDDGTIPWYSAFAEDTDSDGSADEYLRIGAVVDGMTGFIGYSYSEYRFYVEKDLDLNTDNFIYAYGIDRMDTLDLNKGDLSVATFNVLNYFNSEVGGAANPWGSNRGADNADDLALQTAKIVSALVTMDADIVGLMELENNGFTDDSAIVALVTALNAELDADDQYSIVQPAGYDYIGSDAITNAVIYRASEVSLYDATVINMPEQNAPAVTYDGSSTESGQNYQRDALVPTFRHSDSRKKLTIAVNHLKSKGSVCYEDVVTGYEVDDDLQGSCEAFRVSGAYYLAEQLSDYDGYTMIIGDLNSYGSEDAIMLLTNQDNAADDYEIKAAAYTYVDDVELHGEDGAILTDSYGYVNLTDLFDAGMYSYSFDDTLGTLDYILGSANMEDIVVDAIHWNINAGESSYFQYDYSYGDVTLYEDAYRSSDHDPAIVVLDFPKHDRHKNKRDRRHKGMHGNGHHYSEYLWKKLIRFSVSAHSHIHSKIGNIRSSR